MRGTDSSTKVGPGDVEETDSFHRSTCKAFGTEVRGVKISHFIFKLLVTLTTAVLV